MNQGSRPSRRLPPGTLFPGVEGTRCRVKCLLLSPVLFWREGPAVWLNLQDCCAHEENAECPQSTPGLPCMSY